MSTPASSSGPSSKPYGEVGQGLRPKKRATNEPGPRHTCAKCDCACPHMTVSQPDSKRPRLASQRMINGGQDAKETMQAFAAISNILDNIDADDATHIRKGVKSFIESLKSLTVLREQNPQDDIEAIAFSSLTPKHYPRLGVALPKIIPAHVAESFVSAKLALGIEMVGRIAIGQDVIDPFWKQHYPGMFNTIKRVRVDSVNLPETQARMVIDQYAIANLELLDTRAVSLFFTELNISKGDKGPAEILFRMSNSKLYRTFVTGRGDYMFLIGVAPTEELKAYKLEIQRMARNSSLSLLELKDLLDKTETTTEDADVLRMLVMEAKNEGESLKLEDHIPQVVGESLGIITISGQSRIAWCLTTGDAWIFGITTTIPAHANDTQYNVYATETIGVDYDGVDCENQMKRVFSLLAYWTMAPPDEIETIWNRN